MKVGDSSTAQSRMLEEVNYEADWLSSNTNYLQIHCIDCVSSNPKLPTPTITELSTTINLTDVP